jgi:hypothetical protein
MMLLLKFTLLIDLYILKDIFLLLACISSLGIETEWINLKYQKERIDDHIAYKAFLSCIQDVKYEMLSLFE